MVNKLQNWNQDKLIKAAAGKAQCKSSVRYASKLYKVGVNRLVTELFFLILAHSVYKMWIKQEPNMLELWNKLHFEDKKTDSIYCV